MKTIRNTVGAFGRSTPGPDERRYERYTAFCQLLDIEPASFPTWLRETAKISENHDPDRYSTVLRSA